jgi:hypothetical protein
MTMATIKPRTDLLEPDAVKVARPVVCPVAGYVESAVRGRVSPCVAGVLPVIRST